MTWNDLRLLLAIACLGLALSPPAAATQQHAVILVYHHVDESTPAATSVTPAQFEAHLDYLADGGFSVVELADVVAAFRDGSPLPDDAVAITFDDAYASIASTAMPMLAERGWPFSVFVSTDAVDRRLAGYMSWTELRDLRDRGGALENHSASHAHLVRRAPGESTGAWADRVTADIAAAQARIEEETGIAPTLFAYPYGEHSAEVAALVRGLGLAPVGQHSGAAYPATLAAALPRFPVNRAYAGLDTLATKLTSLPLGVERLSPRDGMLGPGDARPPLRIRITEPAFSPGALTCFVGGQPATRIDWQGRVATVRAERALPPGRSSYTCTAPSRERPGRYHWLSFPWLKPAADGRWHDD